MEKYAAQKINRQVYIYGSYNVEKKTTERTYTTLFPESVKTGKEKLYS